MNLAKSEASNAQYRYWAFISYSHTNEAWAKWLHRALETYRVPKRLTQRADAEAPLPRRLLPIFRDTDELPGASNLGAKLEEALNASRCLIVICSPSSAQSKWVDQEIRTFQAAGGADRIFAVIVDGEPNAATDPARECFPPHLRLGAEPLACDARESGDGKSNCMLRLIAGMLGINFDELKRRERRRRIQRAISAGVAGLVLATGFGAIWSYSVNQSNIAESRRRAVEAQQSVGQDPVRSLDLALQATRISPTVEAATALTKALTFQLTRTILNHPSPVVSATFSPDATEVLTCTADGTARVWDARSARLKLALRDQGAPGKEPPRVCAFSPDAAYILTVIKGRDPKIWSARSGQVIASLTGHTGQVLSASFSPDGSKVVTAGVDKTARVWATRTGQRLATFNGHETAVGAAFFFPDGARIVSVGTEGKAFVWTAASGEPLLSFGEAVPVVQDAALSPDGRRLLISNYQYSANLWDPSVGKLIQQLTTRSLGAAFSRDSSRLLTGSGDGRVKVWQSDDGTQVKELPHGGPVSSVLFSPDGSLVVTADERPHIWGMPEMGGGAESEIFALHGHNGDTVAAGFSSDGRLLLTFGLQDRTVRIWDIGAGAYLRSFGEPDPRIGDVAFSPDGSRLLTSGDSIQVWNARTTERLATMQAPPAFSLGEQFSADGRRLIAHCLSGSLCVFDTADGAVILKLDGIQTLQSALSADGSRAAFATADHTVTLVDVPAGNRLKVFSVPKRKPTDIVFSPDGRQILVAFEGGERVWDVSTGQLIRTLNGYGAVFSPDGTRLATMQGDTVRWYDAPDGRLLHESKVLGEVIDEVTFSHDSKWIAAGSAAGVIKVWDVSTGGDRFILRPLDGRVRALRFSGDGKNLIAVTDGAIHYYIASSGTEWQTFRSNFGWSNAAVAPDGSAVIASSRGRALLYSAQLHDLMEAAQTRLPMIGSAP